MADDVIYSNNPALLTLKGQIAVHFLDGTLIEGEFATQDAFNIFLTVDNEPMMIPRSQIRYIRGLVGQPIEKDTSQQAILETETVETESSGVKPVEVQPVEAKPELDDLELALESLTEDEGEDDDGTVVLYAQPLISPEGFEDEEDGTLVLFPKTDQTPVAVKEEPAEAYDDEEDGTLILQPVEVAQPSADEEEDEMDMTVLLDEADAWEELEDEDDQTVVLGGQAEKPQISATLTCTSGPHAGDVLKLTSGITTMGRSSDNVLVLSNDKEISRHHAIVLQESGRFVIQDQNSLNGTFVNDEPITGPHYLQHGDMILVGLSTLKYEEE